MTNRDQALVDALNAAHRALERIAHKHGLSVTRDVEDMAAAIRRLEAAAQASREDR